MGHPSGPARTPDLPIQAVPPDAPRPHLWPMHSFAPLVAMAAPGLVALEAGRARASGFALRPGLLVTSEEALPEDRPIQATLPGGRTLTAEVLARDPATDILLLRVPDDAATPLALTDEAVHPGAPVLALGAEDGAPVAAAGIVARALGPWRSLRGGDIAARIELDLRLRRAAEGGPVLDAEGRVVGMAVFGPRRRTLVIPVATLLRVAAEVERTGRVARPWLGLAMQPVALDGGGHGVLVVGVAPRGPGAQAGLHQGDIVLAFEGAPVASPGAIARQLGPDWVGRPVRLSLRRAGQPVEATLVIGERPAA